MNAKLPTRVFAVWAICLAALVVFHFAVVAPRGRALTASRTQRVAKAERFSFLRNAKSPREQQRLKTEQEGLERQFGDFVFNSEELNELDFRLRGIAEKNALTDFSGRQVGTTTKIGSTEFKKVAQRDLVLSFSGSFADLLRFVNELERHQPIVFVDQFSLRAATGKETGLSCSVECSVLYQPTGQ